MLHHNVQNLYQLERGASPELRSETELTGCRPLDDSVGSRTAGPPHVKVGHTQGVRCAHGAGPCQALTSKAPIVDSIGAFSFAVNEFARLITPR